MYYFPSSIQNLNFQKTVSPELVYNFNSGKNALRAVFRNLKLSKGSKIAIPAYVCAEVINSVEEEFLEPVLFDLKDGNTFWTEYDLVKIKNENVKAIILVHLYGFIHPDTKAITEFCQNENIFLIHDAAQSYGIDEKQLVNGAATVYSFGPGKSTTAAGGGWIKNMNIPNYAKIVQTSKARNFQNASALYFLKTRIYNYKFSKKEAIIHLWNNLMSKSSVEIFEMCQIQKEAASYVLSHLNNISQARKNRHIIIVEKIATNKKISLAYDDGRGIYFKAVLFIEKDPVKFKEYLLKHNVPFFSLFSENSTAKNRNLPNFTQNAANFVELSTEATIPDEEIERVAEIIAKY